MKILIDKDHFTEDEYPVMIKPNFSTLCSIIEISPRGPIFCLVSDDSFRNLLGFNEIIFYKEYNISPNPVYILSFDNYFLECDVGKGMIFKGRRSDIIHNWTMTVDLGYKYVEKFTGGLV